MVGMLDRACQTHFSLCVPVAEPMDLDEFTDDEMGSDDDDMVDGDRGAKSDGEHLSTEKRGRGEPGGDAAPAPPLAPLANNGSSAGGFFTGLFRRAGAAEDEDAVQLAEGGDLPADLPLEGGSAGGRRKVRCEACPLPCSCPRGMPSDPLPVPSRPGCLSMCPPIQGPC